MYADSNAFVYELCIWDNENSFGLDAASRAIEFFEVVVSGFALEVGL